MRSYAAGVVLFAAGRIFTGMPSAVCRKRWAEGATTAMDPVGRFDEEHPLTYILKQPALAWAWYILVGMAGAWLFFRGKRRQQIIPVLPKNENSSYQFIDTIANLHFRERNFGLCQQNMRLFLAKVRERYGLITPMDNHTGTLRVDSDFVQRLSVVSEVQELEIQDIFRQYADTVQHPPTEE